MAIMKTINSIQQFISNKPTIGTDYQNMSLVEERGNIQFPVVNLITDDYFDEFKKASVKVELTEDEILKYKYRPKLLAYDIYDNAELYYIILRLNDLYNVKDFNLGRKYLYLIPKPKLKEYLSDIYTQENTNTKTFNDNHKIKH
jgi:hypothetical protein